MKQLDLMIQDVNYTYEQYARKRGINNTVMYVFYLLTRQEFVTQRDICEMTKIPKQTVNSVVREYQKKGYLETVPSETDRRQKLLHLTPAGQAFAGALLPPVVAAEQTAFAHFSKKQQAQLLKLFGEYNRVFQEEMQKAME